MGVSYWQAKRILRVLKEEGIRVGFLVGSLFHFSPKATVMSVDLTPNPE